MVAGKCGCEFWEQKNHTLCRNCSGLLSACGFQLWNSGKLHVFADSEINPLHISISELTTGITVSFHRVMKNIQTTEWSWFQKLQVHCFEIYCNHHEHYRETLMQHVLMCINVVFLPFFHKVRGFKSSCICYSIYSSLLVNKK